MGKIIINVPSNINKEFTITSLNVTDEILLLVQKKSSQHLARQISLAGIWKDRFTNQTAQEVQRLWRKELWERY